jgi:hypothetical protein
VRKANPGLSSAPLRGKNDPRSHVQFREGTRPRAPRVKTDREDAIPPRPEDEDDDENDYEALLPLRHFVHQFPKRDGGDLNDIAGQ